MTKKLEIMTDASALEPGEAKINIEVSSNGQLSNNQREEIFEYLTSVTKMFEGLN